MNDIDELSTKLLEEAKRFLELADGTDKAPDAIDAYFHAALLLGFSSLEAHVNAVAEELAIRPTLSVLDRSILNEREIRLVDGCFQLTDQLKIYRLEDRLRFIFATFSAAGYQPITFTWWAELKNGISLRNQLVHPKAGVKVDSKAVSRSLTAIIDCLDALYEAAYSRPFPPRNRGLHSSLSF